jgi:hypothetical protein
MSLTWERTKDPDEVVDYELSWADQMTADADTISTSTWTVPAGITKVTSSIIGTNTISKIWFSGGTAGQSYSCLNRVVTAGGRTLDQTVKLKMKDH